MVMSPAGTELPVATPQLTWRTSTAPDDPAWDAFLQETPGGHHNQSSLWGQVKASVGWRAVRVLAQRGDRIVAGAQLLLRPVPPLGAIAFLPKGPLLSAFEPGVAQELLGRAHRLARRHRVRFLLLQPPSGGHQLAAHLPQWGFRSSAIRLLPIATTVVDLQRDTEAILARMKSKTRYNIRLAGRKGINVRQGNAADLPVFYRLLQATARRQGFHEYGLPYFERLQEIFGPSSHFQLFVAEYEGRALSAALLIAFGDTVVYKKGGWSGEEGARHPNELLHWTAMKWARDAGYRYYDFDGINEIAARGLLNGAASPAVPVDSVTRFKLGYGGGVTLNPDPYEYIYNQPLRYLYRRLHAHPSTHRLLEKATHRLLGRQAQEGG